jgi:hypothetical protein
MSIDPKSGGRVHASLGHHAIWDWPSSEFVFRSLYPDASALPNPERLAEFVPRINKVRLTINILAVALAGGLAISVLKGHARRIRPEIR